MLQLLIPIMILNTQVRGTSIKMDFLSAGTVRCVEVTRSPDHPPSHCLELTRWSSPRPGPVSVTMSTDSMEPCPIKP